MVKAKIGKDRRLPSVPPHDGDADAGGRSGHPLHPADARPRQVCDTTQIYTHVSIRQLQKVYEATHPGANLERRSPASQDVDRDAARAELLAALDDEVRAENDPE